MRCEWLLLIGYFLCPEFLRGKLQPKLVGPAISWCLIWVVNTWCHFVTLCWTWLFSRWSESVANSNRWSEYSWCGELSCGCECNIHLHGSIYYPQMEHPCTEHKREYKFIRFYCYRASFHNKAITTKWQYLSKLTFLYNLHWTQWFRNQLHRSISSECWGAGSNSYSDRWVVQYC